MKSISIKINEEFLDLEDFNISLNKQSSDVKDLTARRGGFSYSISVPRTKNNERIFKNAHNIQKNASFLNLDIQRGTIISNGLEIFEGIVKIDSISNDSISFYIISQNIDWADELKGKQMSEVELRPITFYGGRNDGSGYYPTSAVTVEDIWSAQTGDYDIQFPLVSYGNFYVGDIEFYSFFSPYNNPTIFGTDQKMNIIDGCLMWVDWVEGSNINTTSQKFTIEKYTTAGDSTYFKMKDEFGNYVEYTMPPLLITSTTIVGNMRFEESDLRFRPGFFAPEVPQKFQNIHELDLQDIPYSVNLRALIYKMFDDIGWQVSSQYFDSNEFRQLYITYGGDKNQRLNDGTLSKFSGITFTGRLGVQDTVPSFDFDNYFFFDSFNYFSYLVNANTTTFCQLTSNMNEVYDFGNNWIEDKGVYVVPNDGQYRIDVKIKGTYLNTIWQPLNESNRFTFFCLKKNVISGIESGLENETLNQFLINDTSSISDDRVIWYVDFSQNAASWGAMNSWNWGNIGGDGFSLTGSSTSFDYIDIPNGEWVYSGSPDMMIASTATLKRGDIIHFDYGCRRNQNKNFYDYFEFDLFDISIRQLTDVNGDAVDELLTPKFDNKMKQVDFLKGLINQFNLYFSTDQKNKTVYFAPFNEFMLDNQFIKDWSNYIFEEDSISIQPNELAKNTIFQNKQDSNAYIFKRLKDAAWNPLDDGTEYFDSNLPNSEGEQIIESIFGACNDRLYKSYVSGETNNNFYSLLFIPTIGDEKQLTTPNNQVNWSFNYEPRIVEWQGLWEGDWIFEGEIRSTYPRASWRNTTGITLTYSDNAKDIIVPESQQGLFTKHFEQQLTELERGLMYSVKLKLPSSEFANFNFRYPIRFKEGVFRVVSIKNWNPTDEWCQLELIRI